MKVNLIIPRKPELIHPFINDALGKIEQFVSISDKLRHRIKLILIELSTNFIKHSSGSDGKMMIFIDQSCINIGMVNKGRSFLAAIGEDLDSCKRGETIEVFFSETNNHYIKIIDKNKLQFLNPHEHNLRTQLLKDHYGLHIITLASDRFFFEYDNQNKENTFKVVLNI